MSLCVYMSSGRQLRYLCQHILSLPQLRCTRSEHVFTRNEDLSTTAASSTTWKKSLILTTLRAGVDHPESQSGSSSCFAVQNDSKVPLTPQKRYIDGISSLNQASFSCGRESDNIMTGGDAATGCGSPVVPAAAGPALTITGDFIMPYYCCCYYYICDFYYYFIITNITFIIITIIFTLLLLLLNDY